MCQVMECAYDNLITDQFGALHSNPFCATLFLPRPALLPRLYFWPEKLPCSQEIDGEKSDADAGACLREPMPRSVRLRY